MFSSKLACEFDLRLVISIRRGIDRRTTSVGSESITVDGFGANVVIFSSDSSLEEEDGEGTDGSGERGTHMPTTGEGSIAAFESFPEVL